MGGPGTIVGFVVPPGEASRIYEPSALAARIDNFVSDPRGGLRSIVGPTIYEPHSDVVFGQPHGIFHAGLEGGIASTLVVRDGATLQRHEGWRRSWRPLLTESGPVVSGLSNESRATYPDQFVSIGGRIVWTNGVDRARVILPDRMTIPLGFDSPPSAPDVQGPERPLAEYMTVLWSNHDGYSWSGGIGTPGDAIDAEDGAILSGIWYYWAQYEDAIGNLSPLSAPSNGGRIYFAHTRAKRFNNELPDANPFTTVDDLMRSFAVRFGSGADPSHAVAFRILRSKDAARNPNAPRFLVRSPGTRAGLLPDAASDSELGPEVEDNAPVPVFRVMCAHQGRLLIGNTVADPAIVRRSVVGYPGTFEKREYVYPDNGGAEVTALASYAGRAFAFTESSVYDISNFADPQQAARFGCVAPRSLSMLPDGHLGWLSREGFVGYDGQAITLISRPIDDLVTHGINWGRVRRAVSTYDPRHGQYLCALPPSGINDNRLVLVYDGAAWRRYVMRIAFDDLCATDDGRKLVLGFGTDTATGIRNVFVLDHETANYNPPSRSYRYRSGWMRADDQGIVPSHVRTLYICLADASNTSATYEFYADGSYVPVETAKTDLLCVGPDIVSGVAPSGTASRVVTDIAGDATIGTSKFHTPRRFWRKVPVNLQRAREWAFEIRTTNRVHILGFAFDLASAGGGRPEEGIPRAADV